MNLPNLFLIVAVAYLLAGVFYVINVISNKEVFKKNGIIIGIGFDPFAIPTARAFFLSHIFSVGWLLSLQCHPCCHH